MRAGAGIVLLPRSIIDNGLLAQIVVDKFQDKIPLNRQVDRFARMGLDLSISTLCDAVMAAAKSAAFVVNAMHADNMLEPWLQGDDTGLPVQDGTQGATGKGRLWVRASKLARAGSSRPGVGPTLESTFPTPRKRALRWLVRR